MKPTMEILARISQNSSKNKEEVFTRLYRYLLRPDIYYEAYRNLYANSGAATKGVNEDTADGFSEAKINRIIKSLETETYQPKPARRTYIQKANGKMRPLGIPTFTDKLVQDFWRSHLKNIKSWYIEKTQREDDVIISASPEFLLQPACEQLGIKHLMASRVDPHTGIYTGINCWGEEKVCRFYERFGKVPIETFYSDSLSDTPLARLADTAWIVRGDELIPWEEWEKKKKK